MHKDKVLVVDDDESMRDTLEVILKGDYDVIKAGSGEEALKKLSNPCILVVLLDVRLPGISGIETLDRISRKDPDIKCLMLSTVHDVDTVVECMKKGAHDYMTKELEYESVLLRVRNAMSLVKLKKSYDQQIRKVMILEEQLGKLDREREKQCLPHIKDFDLKLPDCIDFQDEGALKIVYERLGPAVTNDLISLCLNGENFTGQEQKVLGLILKGFTNKEIAKELYIELTTVKAHLQNAFQKLGVTTRSQAVACLLIKGLLKNAPSTT